MAADLLAGSPVFAARIAECEDALAPHVDWSLREVLADTTGWWLDRVDVVQPALWAVMVSLAELWRACGVQPAAVVGHSQGEIAAACVAGGLSLADGATVVALRSRALLALSGAGGMVSVPLPEADVAGLLAGLGSGPAGRIGVAAVNGPASTVVSGDVAALDELLARCERDGVRARRIAVDYASHSSQVEAIRADVLAALTGIAGGDGAVPFYSTVTGEPLDTATLDAGYWYENLRRPVRFAAAVQALAAKGHRIFVEVSPHPVLAMGLHDALEQAAPAAAVLETLRRDDGGWTRFVTSAAAAHVHGATVDWRTVLAAASAGGPPPARPVDLPTYPFQRRRYWLETVGLAAGGEDGAAAAPLPDVDAEAEAEAAGSALRLRLAGRSSGDQDRVLLDLVRTHAAAVLGHPDVAAVEPEVAFGDLGFTSLAAVELRNRLRAATGLRLPAALVFSHPNPQALARYLRTEIQPDEGGAAAALAGIDQLEAVLAGIPAGGTDRAEIAGRLEALLRSCRSTNGGTAAGVLDGAALESVTADEMFDLIDKELGTP
jgi:acyl transferase domain-containing protein